MSQKQTTIEFKTNNGFRSLPMVFESSIADKDGAKFFVAATESYSTSGMVPQKLSSGLVLGFGTDELKYPHSGAYTDYFAFSADDDRTVIAEQLREMADWFESQA